MIEKKKKEQQEGDNHYMVAFFFFSLEYYALGFAFIIVFNPTGRANSSATSGSAAARVSLSSVDWIFVGLL